MFSSKEEDNIKLIHGECLEEMAKLEENSIDAVICDLPYGTTSCKWDSIIDMEELWKQYYRVTKEEAPIILFGSQPFTTTLINSNLKDFKYELIYQKTYATGWAMAKKRPMKDHENICLFHRKQPVYNPQMVKSDIPNPGYHTGGAEIYGDYNINKPSQRGGSMDRYPRSIIGIYSQSKRDIPKELKDVGFKCHATQKQLELLQWLVLTYTNPGDIVLDNTMGSGSTGVACKNSDRGFVGIEMDEEYFKMAQTWVGLL